MSRQLWHWKYFEKHPSASLPSEKRSYVTSQHYPKAWCRACILAHVETLHQKDLEDVKHGVSSEIRANDTLRTQAFLAIPSVSGRREGFEPHIRSCKLIDSEAKASLARERTRLAAHSSPLSSGSAQDGSSDSEASTHPAYAPIHDRLSKEQQSELESDLCKLWVANGWAWHSINGPETQAFFLKWFPAVTLPDRHKLSGPILQRELESANSSMKHSIGGRLATGMSDGWKNINRSSLIASMLSVGYVTYTVKVHDVSAEHKTADHHLSLVLSNIEHAEKEHNVRIIAWVSDAGGDSRAMRVRLLSESRWIRSLAARNPEAFRASAGRSADKKQEVETILKHIEDPNFWNRLAELKLYLEPLAIAANVSQAPTTRLDHILIELGRLYYVFLHLAFNPKILKVVLESLERRWGKADQDSFILAVFLNPFIRGRLFNRENILLNRSALYGIVKRVFRRLFRRDNDLELYEAFLDYYEFRSEFSPDRWDYQEQQALHERAGKSLNMINIWSGLLAYQTPNTGRHQLAHLAIHILSIVANSAGCERLFSEMGHIHTKRRNRLGYQKVFDTAVVRMNLKRKHAAEGQTRSRLKRQFGTSILDSGMSSTARVEVNQSDDLGKSLAGIDEADKNSAPPTIRSLATQFQQDALDDEDLSESDHGEEEPSRAGTGAYTTPLPRRVRLFFGTQVPIPLRDLFDYTPSSGAEKHGLDIFKSAGLANLDMELELYGLATQEMQKDLESDDATD
ncbi:hypothetical protein FRC12_009168 [Ceratobasidium sp. 428]|nr:hypothetical protein FRC12_009168 [Ceratobasidium sp. 428]